MAGPIQLLPEGLLGLLQLKQQGRNPIELLETVQPSYDLFQQYALRAETSEVGFWGQKPLTAAIASAGVGFQALNVGGVQAQVPLHEVWYVTHAALDLQQTTFAAASDTIRAGVLVAAPGGFGELITPATQDNVTARIRAWQTEPMARPVFLTPGMSFWAYVFDIGLAAGTRNLELSMRFTRLAI